MISSEEVIPMQCPTCNQSVIAQLKGVADWDGMGYDGGEVSPPEQYTFLHCTNCMSPVLLSRQDLGSGFEAAPVQILYPTQQTLPTVTPIILQQNWDEAQRCNRVNAYIATVIMVRRILEGVCHDKGVETGTLYAKLQKMRNEDHIDDTLLEWAHQLRVVGNSGAHFGDHELTAEDARDSLAFCESFVSHVYVLRTRFEQWKTRHANSAS